MIRKGDVERERSRVPRQRKRMIEPTERDHVSDVASYYQNAILSGKLTAGERLPSERAISARMKVSRSVVREALSRLASLGLVTIRHGSGTRVQSPNGQPVKIGMEQLLSRSDFTLQYLV